MFFKIGQIFISKSIFGVEFGWVLERKSPEHGGVKACFLQPRPRREAKGRKCDFDQLSERFGLLSGVQRDGIMIKTLQKRGRIRSVGPEWFWECF